MWLEDFSLISELYLKSSEEHKILLCFPEMCIVTQLYCTLLGRMKEWTLLFPKYQDWNFPLMWLTEDFSEKVNKKK